MIKLRILFLTIFFSSAAQAALIHATVVSVHDGDTVTLSTGDKIRLAGIDAPEIKQAFGPESRDNLKKAVLNQSVTVAWTKRDKYKRIVAKVYLHRVDQNYLQVRDGFAWHYTKYAKEQSPRDRVRYAKAETDARLVRAGLWSDPNPIAPWEFRHRPLK